MKVKLEIVTDINDVDGIPLEFEKGFKGKPVYLKNKSDGQDFLDGKYKGFEVMDITETHVTLYKEKESIFPTEEDEYLKSSL